MERNGEMDGIADLGGTAGWGRVYPPDPDQEVFAEKWNGRAFALSLLAWRAAGQNVDAFRHALERLDAEAYFGEGNWGRWLNAAETVLLESSLLAPGAIEAWARNLRGEAVEEPPAPKPHRPDYKPTADGSLRPIDTPPAFAPGDHVRPKNRSVPGHSRLPQYVRGRRGVVELVQPSAVLPDTHAHFIAENPQYVYSVRFDSHELWGPEAESFDLTIEMFESYLEIA
jgi:nitrile hydratase beta subunit